MPPGKVALAGQELKSFRPMKAATLPVRSGRIVRAATISRLVTPTPHLIRVDSSGTTNCSAEYEKFIFYRGAGNFATPLRVTMEADAVTLENTGTEPLQHLFVLGLKDGAGKCISVERLARSEKRTVQAQFKLPTSR